MDKGTPQTPTTLSIQHSQVLPTAVDHHWIRKRREHGPELRGQPEPFFGSLPSHELPLHSDTIWGRGPMLERLNIC